MAREKTAQLQVRIEEGMKEKFYRLCKKNAQLPSLVIRQFIESYIEKEERKMFEGVIDALVELDEVDLLNHVGVTLSRNVNELPLTIGDMTRHFEGYTEDMVLENLSTSSLVGADEELAIQEWIAEEEEEVFRKLMKTIHRD